MAVDFTIKRHDRLPEIMASLLDADDVAVNLTDATVRFIMRDKADNTLTVDSPATVVDEDGGIVKYSWDTDDTDVAGNYQAEWEVEFLDGRLESFPNDKYIQIKIKEDLGGIE